MILDIGGNRSLSHLRRALIPRGTLVIVGGESDGRWLGGFDRQMRAIALSPFVRQKLVMLCIVRELQDLIALEDLSESGRITPVIDRAFSLSDVSCRHPVPAEGQARGKVAIAS